ncbi:hypothetical protein V495_08334 [Pseudogymnoascus sp. VKM F-4514 (FW-929)]|nr:hypothetical protein V490_08292 [Pseudogymnoascus sp. VKM F-3557]KFY33248.1 hypothetical protein V495_08334 [Pseudogymnoascus sp. VKM F-4514 (FW-929)]KFY57017.1 hypothetical protein V497_05812 [Pseudogymnoascus sp. VKM F-4516 (FW-969)]
MPPRGFQNPAPKTESAREAAKSFYCELCTKGYSRMPDYEAHLSSYDHAHKQRLRDMKQLTRDPMASEKARKAEAKANAGSGLISIKLGGDNAAGAPKKGGFKKSGFKSAFTPVEPEEQKTEAEVVKREDVVTKEVKDVRDATEESDTDDEGYEHYDPRFPTD